MDSKVNPIPANEYEAEFGPGNVERDVFKLAEARHCEPILPTDAELQLDIDNDEDYALLELQLRRLNEFYYTDGNGPFISDEWESKSGNRHVIVSWPDVLTIHQRIMWQAILGSDRKRELYNALRVMKQSKNPITLFKPKP